MKSHCPTSEMQITTWYTVRKIMCNAELHSKNHPYAILSWTLYLIFGLKIRVGQALCVLCFFVCRPTHQKHTESLSQAISRSQEGQDYNMAVSISSWCKLWGWMACTTNTYPKNWGLCVSDFRYLNPGAPKLKGEFSSANLKMVSVCPIDQ